MPRPTAALAERLQSEGRITANQVEAVIHYMERFGSRVEEAIIESGALPEADLLKYLAKLLNTRFVTTDKLAKADIPQETLAIIPRKVAETLQIFPVVFDPNAGVLSVVSGNAGDPDLVKSVQMATSGNVKEIRVFVARHSAVKAAISKYYGGDIHAFALVDRAQIEQYRSMLDVYERKLITEEALTHSISSRERKAERVVSEQDIDRNARAAQGAPRPGGVNSTGPSGGGTSSQDYIQTLTVLVSLLENTRGELRGHSALVARLIRKIAERIGLSAYEVSAIEVAALLHDIGKASVYHLTALNCSEYEGHRVAAQKVLMAPLRMFESVALSNSTEGAVRSMYERFDGKGFSESLSGKDIPLGARLLAITDTYADLTQNSRNPFRKKLEPKEACEVLAKYRGTILDPNLVDLFRHTVLGDDLKARLLAERPVVLVVEPDAEESTVLELRLLEAGYDVRPVRTPEAALQALSTANVELCIADTELPSATGFDLLARVRELPNGKSLPWVFLSRDARKESVARAFELGASDYVIKPVHSDVLVAKLKRLFESAGPKSGRGVSGALAEMALPDIVQVLAQGRKTGQLKIRTTADSGEIHFDQGQVINAMWGRQRGEDAFYAMCSLNQGEFVLDPNFKPGARVIQASVESLLLEGMRRLDEGTR